MPRVLPPTAVPLTLRDLVAGCGTLVRGCGEEPELFCGELSRFLGVQHVFLSSSGKAALVQILLAMARLRPGKSEVLLPAYTSFSVPSAVLKSGLKVSLYDLDPETLSPNLASLEAALSDSTLCVVVCHLYGYPADVGAVRTVLGDAAIYLIDDAAQALGARFQGRLVGTSGDAGIFSLGRGKPVCAVEGGVVVTNSAELAGAITATPLAPLAWHQPWLLALKACALYLLQRPRLYWIPRCLPFLKLGESVLTPEFPVQAFSSLQAVIGRRMLLRVADINQKRRAIARQWTERLAPAWSAQMIRPLGGAEPIFLRFPLLAGQLAPVPPLGIVLSYPLALDALSPLQPKLSAPRQEYPGATRLAAAIRTLPTHDFVTAEDVKEIVATLAGGKRIDR